MIAACLQKKLKLKIFFYFLKKIFVIPSGDDCRNALNTLKGIEKVFCFCCSASRWRSVLK
jgi:hypothetical protein